MVKNRLIFEALQGHRGMRNELRDISVPQHLARIVFAVALTALVAATTVFMIRWMTSQ